MAEPDGLLPEEHAREWIDDKLKAAGWLIQCDETINLSAGLGVAVEEVALKTGHGFADYMLFVEGKPVGVVEAKYQGHTLTGVESQTEKYSTGLPDQLKAPIRPLPFLYQSTGTITRFTNNLDPEPRSRGVFSFHRPETLKDWLESEPLSTWSSWWEKKEDLEAQKPSTLLSRLQFMPPVDVPNLWDNQAQAVCNLERSLRENRPRSLIQMATGSGKTITAITAIYRLIKFGGAKRVLFLVDRKNLGEQAELEFEGFEPPDDNKKFAKLYPVQRLTTTTIGASSKVVISTIQRAYSMLRGQVDFDESIEEGSQFGEDGEEVSRPMEVEYNDQIPPETFDVIFVDECHRSIYSLWRQVLEYFDAFIIGLTATPAKHTFGFFNKNLVMEYAHPEAVADGVNVDFEEYEILTEITERGATIKAQPAALVGLRNRYTRQVRWEKPDEDITYTETELDRRVVAVDQIRLIIKTFKERLFTEIFPGRKEVPKTLIFAKSDAHAEDIVKIVREEFAKGNDFARKITYKTTGIKTKDLIKKFRTSFNPRIAVTVDMIATGTDIKPIEIVMFMRNVKSRVLYEQMKGRGVRIIDDNDLQTVTPDADAKTHFVLIDCVGVITEDKEDSHPLERKKTVSLGKLLELVALGACDEDTVATLASRLSRLDKKANQKERDKLAEVSDGESLTSLAHRFVASLNTDAHVDAAHEKFNIPKTPEPTDEEIEAATREKFEIAEDKKPTKKQLAEVEEEIRNKAPRPTEEQVEEIAEAARKEALKPIATNGNVRFLLEGIQGRFEQVIDEITQDKLLKAGVVRSIEDKANEVVTSFRQFIEENKDEIDALQFFYSQPYERRLTLSDIEELRDQINAPPRRWTTDKLWEAYEALEKGKVKKTSGQRILTDLISLIRFTLEQEDELVPYPEKIQERFGSWLAQQENEGKTFSEEQRQWLMMIRDHIATSLEIEIDDLDSTPFSQQGGIGKAIQVFGSDLGNIIEQLNEALAA